MAKITVGETANAALASLAPAWRKAWGAVALFAVGDFGWRLLTTDQRVVSRLIRSPALFFGSYAIGFALFIVLSVPLLGAVMRQCLGERDRMNPKYKLGPAGLQWRPMETRLLLVSLFSNLLAFLAIVIVVVVSVVALVASSPGVPPRLVYGTLYGTPSKAVLVGITAIIVGAPMVWVACRLATNAPATADQDRVTLFRSWPYTRGLLWPMVAALVGVWLVTVVAGWLVGTVNLLLVITRDAVPLPNWLATGIPMAMTSTVTAAFVPATYGLTAFIYRTANPAANIATVFD